MRINKQDTDGTKALLGKGELGYDDYTAGGDTGRVYVGTGDANVALAKKSEVDAHTSRVDNPHSVTKTQVGLGNVDNTSDANKPVSTAQQAALNLKLDASSYTASDVLTKVKTVDGAGSGLDADLLDGNDSTYFATASGLSTHTARTDNPHAVTKTQVGLGNVDNTSDVNKPVSTATQTSLNTKVDKVTSTDNAIVRFDGTTGNVQNSGVVIDDSGNVGIGTSSPSSKLEVKGNSIIGFSSGTGIDTVASGLKLRNGTAGNPATGLGVSLDFALGTNYNPEATNAKIKCISDYYGARTSLTFETANDSNVLSEKMRIDSNGNVGIGTSSPTDLLHIENNTGTKGITLNNTSGAGANGIVFKNSGTSNWTLQALADSSKAFRLFDYVANAERLRVNSNGNLLIGTSTDNGVDKLQVNGSISANSYINKVGQFKTFSRMRTCEGGIPYTIEFTLSGDDSFDLEIIKTGNAFDPQFVKIIFGQMAQVGRYSVINNTASCTVTTISTALNAYRYRVSVPSGGEYTGYSVNARFFGSTINSFD